MHFNPTSPLPKSTNKNKNLPHEKILRAFKIICLDGKNDCALLYTAPPSLSPVHIKLNFAEDTCDVAKIFLCCCCARSLSLSRLFYQSFSFASIGLESCCCCFLFGVLDLCTRIMLIKCWKFERTRACAHPLSLSYLKPNRVHVSALRNQNEEEKWKLIVYMGFFSCFVLLHTAIKYLINPHSCPHIFFG
jgi:hypothetical protein